MFAGLMLGRFIDLMYRIFLARALSPAEYGLFFLAYNIIFVASTVAIGGFPQGLMRYVAYYKGKKDKARVKGVMIDAGLVMAGLGVVSGAIVFLLAEWLASLFHTPGLTPIFQIVAFFLPAQALFLYSKSVLEGFQRLKYWFYGEIISTRLLRLVLTIVLVSLGFGLLGISLIFVFTVAIGFVVMAWFASKKVFPNFRKIKAVHGAREYLSFAAPLFFSSSILAISGHIDTIMIGLFMSTASVGFYNVALPLAALLRMFLASFNGIFAPMTTELFAKNKMKEVGALYKSVTKWAFMSAWPVFLLFFAFPGQVIELFFGPGYGSGAIALAILSVGYLVNTGVGSAGVLLLASGKPKLLLINNAVIAVLNIAFNWLLIPVFGLVGAAVATSFSVSVINLLMLAEVKEFLGFHPYKKSFLRPLAAGVVAAIAAYAGFAATGMFIAAAIGFAALYILLVFVFKSFEKEDLVIATAIEKKLGWGTRMSGFLGKYSA